jgi:2-isopropylmalate synthase
MAKERLYLFDTTLRDGAQTTGVDFSLEDKRLIAGSDTPPSPPSA